MTSNNAKVIERLLSFLLGIILLFSVTFYLVDILKNKEKNLNYYTSTLYIESSGNVYEVLVREEDKATIYRENGKDTVVTLQPRTVKERLNLPDLDLLEGEDVLLGRLPVKELTWNVDFQDSFKYIKYKIDEGYSIVMQVSTPTFVELVLQNEGKRLRFIVFQESMMMAEMLDSAPLPNINSYLSQYGIEVEED